VDKQIDELADFIRLNDNTYYREVKVEGKRRQGNVKVGNAYLRASFRWMITAHKYEGRQ
jgi:hypothetical protein